MDNTHPTSAGASDGGASGPLAGGGGPQAFEASDPLASLASLGLPVTSAPNPGVADPFHPFQGSLEKVLQQLHPEFSITAGGARIVVTLVDSALERVVRAAVALAAAETTLPRMLVNSRDIQAAVRLSLPGELAEHAASEGTKAVTKWCGKRSLMGAPACVSTLVGLMFSCAATAQRVQGTFAPTALISEGAIVYATTVCEYLCAEVLELSGIAARDLRAVFICPRHVMLAVRNDEELSKLFSGTIPYGHLVDLCTDEGSKDAALADCSRPSELQELEEEETPASLGAWAAGSAAAALAITAKVQGGVAQMGGTMEEHLKVSRTQESVREGDMDELPYTPSPPDLALAAQLTLAFPKALLKAYFKELKPLCGAAESMEAELALGRGRLAAALSSLREALTLVSGAAPLNPLQAGTVLAALQEGDALLPRLLEELSPTKVASSMVSVILARLGLPQELATSLDGPLLEKLGRQLLPSDAAAMQDVSLAIPRALATGGFFHSTDVARILGPLGLGVHAAVESSVSVEGALSPLGTLVMLDFVEAAGAAIARRAGKALATDAGADGTLSVEHVVSGLVALLRPPPPPPPPLSTLPPPPPPAPGCKTVRRLWASFTSTTLGNTERFEDGEEDGAPGYLWLVRFALAVRPPLGAPRAEWLDAIALLYKAIPSDARGPWNAKIVGGDAADALRWVAEEAARPGASLAQELLDERGSAPSVVSEAVLERLAAIKDATKGAWRVRLSALRALVSVATSEAKAESDASEDTGLDEGLNPKSLAAFAASRARDGGVWESTCDPNSEDSPLQVFPCTSLLTEHIGVGGGGGSGPTVSLPAAAAFASALQYLCLELLETIHNKGYFGPASVAQALCKDPEYADFVKTLGGAAIFARSARAVARAANVLTSLGACFPATLFHSNEGALPTLLCEPAPEEEKGGEAAAAPEGTVAAITHAECTESSPKAAVTDVFKSYAENLGEYIEKAVRQDYAGRLVYGGVLIGRSRAAGAPLAATALTLRLYGAVASLPSHLTAERLTLMEVAIATVSTANRESAVSGEHDCALPEGYLPPNWVGEPTLHSTAQFGLERALRVLLARGDPVEARRPTLEDGPDTPLLLACESGSVAVVRALLEAGASTGIVQSSEVDVSWSPVTPLINAIERGKLAVARALVEGGADVNESTYEPDDEYFETPLYVAKRKKIDVDFCAFLVQHGAKSSAGTGAVEQGGVPV